MESGGNASVAIRVAYATREEQVIIELSVPDGTTIQEAIQRSGILNRYPDIDSAAPRGRCLRPSPCLGLLSSNRRSDRDLPPLGA